MVLPTKSHCATYKVIWCSQNKVRWCNQLLYDTWCN